MGLQHPNSPRNDLTPHYSREIHPVQGQVSLFKLKGCSLFLFTAKSIPSSFQRIADQVQEEGSQSLCQYYGQLLKKQHISLGDDYTCCRGESMKQNVFWTYHNYTLADEIQYNRRIDKMPEQQDLWSLIKVMVETSSILMKYGIYLDFSLKNILVSASKKKQVYWGNCREDQSHRQFYRTVFGQKVSKDEGLSPQELKSLIKNKATTKFDLEKCIIHSMARTILLYANGSTHHSDIIDFQAFKMQSHVIDNALKRIGQTYSRQFTDILKKMLKEEPKDRINLNGINMFFKSGNFPKLKLKTKQKSIQSTSPSLSSSSNNDKEAVISQF